MTDTELLENTIAKSGFRKGWLAQQIGISLNAFTMKCTNRTEFKVSEVNKLMDLLNLTPEEGHLIFFKGG